MTYVYTKMSCTSYVNAYVYTKNGVHIICSLSVCVYARTNFAYSINTR